MDEVKILILTTDMPFSVPKTEAMPNIAAKIPPSKNAPTEPNGEILNSFFNPIGLVVWNAGAGCTDSKIGAKDSDITTEPMMNKTKPSGAATFSIPWDTTIPSICTIK